MAAKTSGLSSSFSGFKVENIPKLSFFFAAPFRQLFEDFFDAHLSCLKVTGFSHFGHTALSGGDASCLQNILGRCDLLCFLGVRLGIGFVWSNSPSGIKESKSGNWGRWQKLPIADWEKKRRTWNRPEHRSRL